jgi:hypothetical protein
MRGNRRLTQHDHVGVSHWAGPGLVRTVCIRCGRVGLDLNEPTIRFGQDQDLGVDVLSWMLAGSSR